MKTFSSVLFLTRPLIRRIIHMNTKKNSIKAIVEVKRMGKLTKKGSGEIIPRDIGDMSLNELLGRRDVEVHKKDNILKMKRKTSTETLTIEVRSYDDASVVSQSRTSLDKPFNQMGTTIAKMRAEGKTQAEVAEILGTTQTNISKIEKKMKK